MTWVNIPIITDQSTTGPTIQIVLVHDHYAVLASGFVVGTIERYYLDQGWTLNMLDGVGGIAGPVPLRHAMEKAMRWRQP